MKIAIILSLLAMSACGGSDLCNNDSDCFSVGVCVDGYCQPPAQMSSTNNQTASLTNNIATNNELNNNATNNSTNNHTTNTSGTNNPTSGATNNPQTNNTTNNTTNDTCVVGPFATCSDPAENMTRNDIRASATRPSDPAGCVQGEIITPISYSVQGQLCAREPADWYVQGFLLCDNLDQIARVKVTPAIPCAHSDWELSVVADSSQLLSCELEGVKCTQEGGAKIVEWIIPASYRDIASYYFGIEADQIQFAYSVEFTVR